jgi:predicted amidohydrolase YtcJ
VLIRNAEVLGHGRGDVRIRQGTIVAIGDLTPEPGEPTLEGRGGMLLPGLHDHHIHLPALAARQASVPCGPPEVGNAAELTERLAAVPGSGWIRGIGYHESVLGCLPDKHALDAMVSDRPLRIQHRSGRMWLLNSAALDELLRQSPAPPGLEREGGRFTGRLFDEDAWLQQALGSTPPDLSHASIELASYGVTGVTDMTPRNDPVIAANFASQREAGALLQRCVLAGTLSLAQAEQNHWQLGPAKLHLHEAALPSFGDATEFIGAAHGQDRPVAIHCVSELELVFALALLDEAGAHQGDRIEHISVASLELVDEMARLGLHACVQPHFIVERGDRYLLDVEPRDHPHLYRLRALTDSGIALAGGSDAPYGSADPWTAMAAAVSRHTASGAAIGIDEALTPEQALALYLADPLDVTRSRPIAVGTPADLCLLDRPWNEARLRLCSSDVVATIVAGRIVHHRVDQPPVESLRRADSPT